MSIVALITWFSAATCGLLLLAARLIEYTSAFQGAAATRLPVPVIFAGPADSAKVRDSSVWHGVMT